MNAKQRRGARRAGGDRGYNMLISDFYRWTDLENIGYLTHESFRKKYTTWLTTLPDRYVDVLLSAPYGADEYKKLAQDEAERRLLTGFC